VQHTPGAEIISDLDVGKIDRVVEKGVDERVEMYSAFTDPFHQGEEPWSAESTSVSTTALPKILKEMGIMDVFIVGLAGDFCVKATVMDSRRFGFRTYVVREGTMAANGEKGMEDAVKEMEAAGVRVVGEHGVEVGWVRGLLGKA